MITRNSDDKGYQVWVTEQGITLHTSSCRPGIVKTQTLTPQEAMDLLRALYSNRDRLMHALHPERPYMRYACPACSGLCELEHEGAGYYGTCADCGNDFHLNIAGNLLAHAYQKDQAQDGEEETA